MDAKYVAVVLIFISFSVFSFGESEDVETIQNTERAPLELPAVPACTDNHDLGASVTDRAPGALAVGESPGSAEDIDAVEHLVLRVSCLLASA